MITKNHFGIKYSVAGTKHRQELLSLAIVTFCFLLLNGKTSWASFSRMIYAHSDSKQAKIICNTISSN